MQQLQIICDLYDARLRRCHPVSSRINHVGNDDEECSRPVEITDAQKSLFISSSDETPSGKI